MNRIDRIKDLRVVNGFEVYGKLLKAKRIVSNYEYEIAKVAKCCGNLTDDIINSDQVLYVTYGRASETILITLIKDANNTIVRAFGIDKELSKNVNAHSRYDYYGRTAIHYLVYTAIKGNEWVKENARIDKRVKSLKDKGNEEAAKILKETKLEIDHINNDTYCNDIDNLQLLTAKANKEKRDRNAYPELYTIETTLELNGIVRIFDNARQAIDTLIDEIGIESYRRNRNIIYKYIDTNKRFKGYMIKYVRTTKSVSTK